MSGTALRALAFSLALLAAPAAAETLAETGTLVIADGSARAAGAAARSGAGYVTLTNTGDADDRLVAAESPAAERVELHNHIVEDGIARMIEIEGGIPLPAGETVSLEQGGMHIMFLGLTDEWGDDGIPVTLVFEQAGKVEVTLPLAASPAHDHGGHHPEQDPHH